MRHPLQTAELRRMSSRRLAAELDEILERVDRPRRMGDPPPKLFLSDYVALAVAVARLLRGQEEKPQ